jgi:hypothetical protein
MRGLGVKRLVRVDQAEHAETPPKRREADQKQDEEIEAAGLKHAGESTKASPSRQKKAMAGSLPVPGESRGSAALQCGRLF